MQEDIEILKNNQHANDLTFNQKNCVIVRKGEKEILHYLVSIADKVSELGKLTVDEAKQQMSKWEGHDKRCEPYFTNVFLKLLHFEQLWQQS